MISTFLPQKETPVSTPTAGNTPDQPTGTGTVVTATAPAPVTPATAPSTTDFIDHPVRGRLNAAFFRVMGGYLDKTLRRHKEYLFGQLRHGVVEIGPGVGANLRYLRGGSLIAIEPNRNMHRPLRASAHRHRVSLDLREAVAEDTGLPDASVDTVISSLVLCSVTDPAAVLAEIRRILHPGGTFRFIEHVAAADGTLTRASQRALRHPWGWAFEGCSCERDLEQTLRDAGFSRVHVERYRVHTPFVPFNTQIAGMAWV